MTLRLPATYVAGYYLTPRWGLREGWVAIESPGLKAGAIILRRCRGWIYGEFGMADNLPATYVAGYHLTPLPRLDKHDISIAAAAG